MGETEQRATHTYKGIRLVAFEIVKLFDEFSYRIPLKEEERVTAIVAPNGAGKTLCLRMISALFERKWSIFTDCQYTTIKYIFNDKTVITVFQVKADLIEDTAPKRPSFRLVVTAPNNEVIVDWSHTAVDPARVAAPVERYLPFVTRVGPNEWRHDSLGDAYTLQELVDTYGNSIPEVFRNKLFGKIPEVLSNITSQIDCHLIETQRLLILRDDKDDTYNYRPGRRPKSTLAIARKAQALKEIISNDISVYASLSQSLDRSFPRRVIGNPTTLSSDDLKKRLNELDRRRNELMEAGILDTEADDPVAISDGVLDSAISRVLSVYADDNQQKLSSLDSLLAKIKLFKELIDERFVTKDVSVTKQNGIEVSYKGHRVPIEGLSSGEQHQLVLFFELLFEIKQNSLILIDEPELSLHVAWQKKFIGDLMKIIALNKFDVILATHSPQLIGRWNNLVVELGDIYDDEASQDLEVADR